MFLCYLKIDLKAQKDAASWQNGDFGIKGLYMYSCARSNKSPWSSSLGIPRAQVVPRQRISTSRFSRLLRQSGNGRRPFWLGKGEVGRGKHLILCEPAWRAKIKATELKFDHYLFIVPSYRRQLIASFEFLLIYFRVPKIICQDLWTIKVIEMRSIELNLFVVLKNLFGDC